MQEDNGKQQQKEQQNHYGDHQRSREMPLPDSVRGTSPVVSSRASDVSSCRECQDSSMRGSSQIVRGRGDRGRARTIPRAPRRNFCIMPSGSPSAPALRRKKIKFFEFSRSISSEPVELQIEGLSPIVTRAMLYMWYAVLIAAIVVQSMEFLSLDLMNLCGGRVRDLRNYEGWSSSCVQKVVENVTSGLYTVYWEGGSGDLWSDQYMARYPTMVISLLSPDDWGGTTESTRVYDIEAVIPYAMDYENNLGLPISIKCKRSYKRCDYVELPPQPVLYDTPSGKKRFALRGVPGSLARGANSSSIGIIFQSHGYSLGVFVWRYLFIFLSFLHLVRFVVYKKFTSTLYEQSWVVVLQLAFFWYMNPLYALSYRGRYPSSVLIFLEFHFPTWFAAVVLGFMLSATTASMSWTPPKTDEQFVTYDLSTLSGIKGYLCHSSSVYDPPLWTKCLIVLSVVSILVLSIVGEVINLTASADSQDMYVPPIYYLLISFMVLEAVVCCILLFYVHRNMGEKPYLESRPQQLASRVLILIFMMSIAYYIFHVLMFIFRYRKIPGMPLTHPLLQLPAIMVATFIVNIMTLVYTTRNRSRLFPIHPQDPRWKCMVWPDTWYRWLNRHGGSMYIFNSEDEEMWFNFYQSEYRFRQEMARKNRKRNRAHRFSLKKSQPRHVQREGQNSHARHAGIEPFPEEVITHGVHETSAREGVPLNDDDTTDNPDVINMNKASTFFFPENQNYSAFMLAQPQFHKRARTMEVPDRNEHAQLNGFSGLHRRSRTQFLEPTSPSAVQFESYPHARNIPSAPFPCSTSCGGERESELGGSNFSNMTLTMKEADVMPWERGKKKRSYPDEGKAGRGGERKIGEGKDRDDAESGEYYERDDDDDDDHDDHDHDHDGGGDEVPNAMLRRLGRFREGLVTIMRLAERNLISRPVEAFEQFETALLDAAARPFQNVPYLPFFNIESAIDCFNLSWEAYGATQRPEGYMEKTTFCIASHHSGLRSPSASPSFPTITRNGEMRLPVEDVTRTRVNNERPPTVVNIAAGTATGVAEVHAEEVQIDLPPSAPPMNVERHGYRLCEVKEAENVQVIITALDPHVVIQKKKPPRIVIAFRGTINMTNAWQDLRFRRREWREMIQAESLDSRRMFCGKIPSVHGGFLKIWDAHREYILEKLWEYLSARSEVYRIFCTGHSLGGALAVLCAYSVKQMLVRKEYKIPEVTVYTFGQPPVGNKPFQTYYNKAVPCTFRVVNESDPVALIRMYGCQVGVEVDVDRYGNYICKPTYMERMFRPMKGKGFFHESHYMERYGASLGAIAEKTECPARPFLGGNEEGRNNEGEQGSGREDGSEVAAVAVAAAPE